MSSRQKKLSTWEVLIEVDKIMSKRPGWRGYDWASIPKKISSMDYSFPLGGNRYQRALLKKKSRW